MYVIKKYCSKIAPKVFWLPIYAYIQRKLVGLLYMWISRSKWNSLSSIFARLLRVPNKIGARICSPNATLYFQSILARSSACSFDRMVLCSEATNIWTDETVDFCSESKTNNAKVIETDFFFYKIRGAVSFNSSLKRKNRSPRLAKKNKEIFHCNIGCDRFYKIT